MTSQFATVNASVTDVNSKVSAVSGRLDNLDVLKANIAKTQIVITSGNRQNSGSLSKAGTWTVSDIMISPANAYAAKFPAYPVSVTADGLITIRGTFMGQDIVTYVPTPLGINSTITSTSALSTQRTGDFVQSLSVNTDNINTFISNLTLSTFDIVAEQDAIYNVYAINFSS